MNTDVFLVTLYAAYPVIFYATNNEMSIVHEIMSLPAQLRGNLVTNCWSDMEQVRTNPEQFYVLDIDASQIFGYSFSVIGHFTERAEVYVAEGVH